MKIKISNESIFEILPFLLLRIGRNASDKLELNLSCGWLYKMCQISIIEWNYSCKIYGVLWK